MSASGCENGSPLSDPGFNLMESMEVTSVTMPAASASGFTEVTFLGINRYAGRGTVLFAGRCGGSRLGILHAPARGDVGAVTAPLELPAGPFEIVAVIDVDCNMTACMLDVVVHCDSLYVDGVAVAWDSAEGRGVYGADLPDGVGFLANQASASIELACSSK